MKAESRIRKIEEATGINEPCVVCDVLNSELAEFFAWFVEKGLNKPEDTPRDLMPRVCHWCGKTRQQDVTDYSVSERALIERHDGAWFAGRFCAAENKGLHDELLSIYDERSREQLGIYYEAGRAMTNAAIERTRAYIEERHPCPFYHYICTVEGCTCEYPKSEAEWHRNVQRRLAA
jgi:hypothetical protein